MILFRKIARAGIAIVISSFVLTGIFAAQAAHKPVRIQGGKGPVCIILPYDFDSAEKEFPRLNLPDNSILALAIEDGDFRPEKLAVAQGGKMFNTVGIIGYYAWGSFYAIYYDPAFNKFQPFEARYGEASQQITAADITALKGGAIPAGQRAFVDPVSDSSVANTPVIELADLLARGRAIEYADEALSLRGKGGLALIRATALKAFEQKDYQRAASLAAEAIRWSPSLEPPDVTPVTKFLDWVTIARSFMALGQPLAAVRAYDEALGIRKEKIIQQERQDAWNMYAKKGGNPPISQYQESFSEAELELEAHGQIPIPASERGFVREGISADGVFIGDPRERIRAQCGPPSESFSGMLLYPDHPTCPEAIFFTAQDRAYAIRTVRGKTIKGVSIGDPLKKALDVYGAPDRKETQAADPNKKSVRWIYLKQKVAFSDLNGSGVIQAIDIFDYSLNR